MLTKRTEKEVTGHLGDRTVQNNVTHIREFRTMSLTFVVLCVLLVRKSMSAERSITHELHELLIGYNVCVCVCGVCVCARARCVCVCVCVVCVCVCVVCVRCVCVCVCV